MLFRFNVVLCLPLWGMVDVVGKPTTDGEGEPHPHSPKPSVCKGGGTKRKLGGRIVIQRYP